MKPVAVILCLSVLFQQGNAFGIESRPTAQSSVSSPLWRRQLLPASTAPLTIHTRQSSQGVVVLQDSKNSDDIPEPESVAATNATASRAAEPLSTSSSSGTEKQKSSDGGGGVVRTILLAGPLFCKFVIVLVIKFLTDLVVYPLLVLYRLCRLAKRRIIRMIRGRGKDNMKNISPNGASNNNNNKS